jgi:AcrR family transcriptional regulator
MSLQLIRERMLTAVNPVHGADPPRHWQQRKSAGTRLKLVETAIDCLIEGGYASFSAAHVAQRCGVSRGAMHHHFATRMELVAATIEHVFYKRMGAYLDAYLDALATNGNLSSVEIASELHWQSVHSREYSAYVELAVAARTDRELAHQFVPQAQRYDTIWFDEMSRAFPQWQAHWDDMRLANDLTTVAHMGMLMLEPVLGEGERSARIRGLVTQMVESLYRGR